MKFTFSEGRTAHLAGKRVNPNNLAKCLVFIPDEVAASPGDFAQFSVRVFDGTEHQAKISKKASPMHGDSPLADLVVEIIS